MRLALGPRPCVLWHSRRDIHSRPKGTERPEGTCSATLARARHEAAASPALIELRHAYSFRQDCGRKAKIAEFARPVLRSFGRATQNPPVKMLSHWGITQ